MDFELTSNDPLSIELRAKDVNTWAELLSYVRSLPYGRNENRVDLSLVMSEGKGTCSSKHAFLKMIAEQNDIPNVKLMLGMYKMNHDNTPGIGSALENAALDYIPEAHCYLKLGQDRLDVTRSGSDIRGIEWDILEEQEITPSQVADFKVEYHKRFLKEWLLKTQSDIGIEELWCIREQCIKKLEN